MVTIEHDLRGLAAKALLMRRVDVGQLLADVGRLVIDYAIAKKNGDVELASRTLARLDFTLDSFGFEVTP